MKGREPKGAEGEIGECRVVDMSVSRAVQAEYHEVAPVDTKLFGDDADPTFFCQMLTAAQFAKMFSFERVSKEAKKAPNGAIHMSEELKLHRMIRLDETVTLCQEESALTPHRQGTLETARFNYRDAAGAVVMEVRREVIWRPGWTPPPGWSLPAALEDAPNPAPKAGEPDARANSQLYSEVQFSPQLVVDFCNDWAGANPIHHDPEIAKKAGYRVPIWGGVQGMHICLAHLHQLGKGQQIKNLHAVVKFKRPVGWDEKVELWYGQPAGAPFGVGRHCLLNPRDAHKVAMEMEVRSMEYMPRSSKL